MKRIFCAALLAAFISPVLAEVAAAGPISRACMASPRKQKSSGLCRCIQNVANKTMTKSDQRKAAKFFKKPQLAQNTRQSNNRSNEVFWKRYKNFGATAAAICG